MSPRPKPAEPTIQVAIRLPVSLVEELDAMASEVAPPGMTATRSDVIKVFLREAMEARRASRKKKR